MENARATALFLIIILLVGYWIVFKTTMPMSDDATEAVHDQGTNFKGTANTGVVYITPPLSIPMPNWSANGYAGKTPEI